MSDKNVSKAERTIAFFPWVVLHDVVKIGNVHFLPFRDRNENIPGTLSDLTDVMPVIISSYRDLEGKPLSNCTVACIEGKNPPWELDGNDVEPISRAASFLALASLAANDYFCVVGHYSNTTIFQPYFQRFTLPVDQITLTIRRRDGRTLSGGYKHGEVLLSIPLQCTQCKYAAVDAPLAESLGNAYLQGSPVIRRLVPALSFFNLANTDYEPMQPEAEVILIGSAFEQLLGTSGAHDLSCKMGELFKAYGSVSVDGVLASRPGIDLDAKYQTQQKQWFIHRKWAEELYDLRSKLIHGESTSKRNWGWTLLEHLIMGAFVFPLAVKLMLAQEGHYKLAENDEALCRAVDVLLDKTDWKRVIGSNSDATTWRETIRKVKSGLNKQRIKEKILRQFGESDSAGGGEPSV